jgi:myosin heavy subunit
MDYVAVDDHDHAGVADDALLGNIATLLSVTKENLKKALCSRVIAAGGQVVEKQLTLSDAVYARDAFAKVKLIKQPGLVLVNVILSDEN